jgi:hypothetical protein
MAITPEFLAAQLELADTLYSGRSRMLEPQDLPGRYGRAVAAIDRFLRAAGDTLPVYMKRTGPLGRTSYTGTRRDGAIARRVMTRPRRA